MSGGGYARGEETRLRIIRAALDLFGAQGYERTSTREIAAKAGVNAPALQYYFEGKDGLYLACAEYMAARGNALMASVIDTARTRLSAKATTEDLVDCVCSILEQAADFVLMSTELESWTRFMAWEDLGRTPARALAVIDKSLKREFNDMMRALVGRITGKPAGDTETRIRVLLLSAQVTVFGPTRRRALHDIGWTDVDATGLEKIKALIRSQTRAALAGAAKQNRHR